MYEKTLRQAWVEIDLGAVQHNIEEIKKQLDGQRIIAVIKADAYGHGSVEVAKTLLKSGVDCFAVATIAEGLHLRNNGIENDILILGFVPDECFDVVVSNNFTPVIGRIESAKTLSDAAIALNKIDYGFMFALDTGMGRIGYCVKTDADRKFALDAFVEMNQMPGIKAIGTITHFSTADEEDTSYTETQIDYFEVFSKMVEDAGYSIKWVAANSAAIMVHHKALYDAVRPGVILYGTYPSTYLAGKVLDLQPVMSVKASIANIKTVPSGTSLSYGRKYTSDTERVIATIPIGYADGYARALSGKIEVIVDGKRCPVLGNICMDQCMIDVSDVPGATIGTEVVIMGSQGGESVTADDMAALLGTINYEITCDFGLRLPKVYK